MRFVFASLVLAATAARAEADWFASLYTGDGIELRADERVFTLYALFNALGYDEAPLLREHPIPRRAFHPVRIKVRERVLADEGDLKKQADAFFDGHALPIDRYLAYALSTSPPPFASGPKSRELADLKGLEALLAKAHAGWKLDELLASVQADYRKALRAYLPVLDGPIGKAKKILRLSGDGPQCALVVNLLDSGGVARGLRTDSEVVVVVGPSEKPDVEAVVRELARALIGPSVAKKAQTGWSGGQALLREAKGYGATEQTVGDYAASLFARAVALKAMDASDAAYEAAAQKGYFGLKDIAQRLDDGKPIDGWALDALARAETRRPTKK